MLVYKEIHSTVIFFVSFTDMNIHTYDAYTDTSKVVMTIKHSFPSSLKDCFLEIHGHFALQV